MSLGFTFKAYASESFYPLWYDSANFPQQIARF